MALVLVCGLLLSARQIFAWLMVKLMVVVDVVVDALMMAAAGYLGLLGAAAAVGVCCQLGRLAIESKRRGDNFDALIARALFARSGSDFSGSMARARVMEAVDRVAPGLKKISKRSEALRHVRLHRGALRDDKALASWASELHDVYERGQDDALIKKIDEAKAQESWRAFALVEMFARLLLWAISLGRHDWCPAFKAPRFTEDELRREQGWARLLELQLMTGDRLLIKALGEAPEALVLPANTVSAVDTTDAEAELKALRLKIEEEATTWDGPSSLLSEAERVARENLAEAPRVWEPLLQDVQRWRERLSRFPEAIYASLSAGEVDPYRWPDWFREGIGAVVEVGGQGQEEELKRRYCVRAWVLGTSEQDALLPEPIAEPTGNAEVIELAAEVEEYGPVVVAPVEEMF